MALRSVKSINVDIFNKGKSVTTGGKAEAGEVTGVIANVSIMDGLGKRYGAFGRRQQLCGTPTEAREVEAGQAPGGQTIPTN